MRDKVNDLKSQIHTAVDLFYEETGFLPVIEVATKETEHEGRKYLASSIEVILR